MSFDGIRTSQVNPQVASSLMAYGASREVAKKHNVERQQRTYRGAGSRKRDSMDEFLALGPEEPREDFLSEEEREEILRFAKLRGLMNFAFKEGRRYHFQLNPDSGLVDLIELDTGELQISLRPEELMALSDKIHRYAGLMTDQAG